MNYQRILAITINPGLAIVGTLPSATVSEAYSATLQGYGGVEPYTWSIVSGSLPSGFSASIDSNGDYVISGTTTDIGDHALVIMLEDSAGRSVARRFNLRVIALPLVISGHAPDGEVGTAYTFTYTVSGGLAPYSFFVASGSLPSGLSLNASTGTISGTPTAVQSTAFTIQVRDSQSPYASANQYDTVNVQADLLQVSGTFATPVENGDPLTGSLTITGGVSPYSVSVYSGTAPPGVTFSVSGSSVVASGNTTTDGSYSWTLRVTSTDGQHADSAQSVTVESASYSTWNPSDKHANITLSNGNMRATTTTDGGYSVRSTAAISGKRYFEFELRSDLGGEVCAAGVATASEALTKFVGETTKSAGEWYPNNTIYANNSVVANQTNSSPGSVQRYKVCVDSATRKVWISREDLSYPLSGDPAAGTNPTYTLSGTDGIYACATPYENVNTYVDLVSNPADMTGSPPSGFTAGI